MSTTRFAADRFIYVFASDGRLSSGNGTTLDVFVDIACTQSATLTDLTGASISSRLVVGTDSLLPEFLDPQGHTVLYVRPLGSTEVSRIESLKASLWTGTQAEYDAMTSHDPFTIYAITG